MQNLVPRRVVRVVSRRISRPSTPKHLDKLPTPENLSIRYKDQYGRFEKSNNRLGAYYLRMPMTLVVKIDDECRKIAMSKGAFFRMLAEQYFDKKPAAS